MTQFERCDMKIMPAHLIIFILMTVFVMVNINFNVSWLLGLKLFFRRNLNCSSPIGFKLDGRVFRRTAHEDKHGTKTHS